MCTPSYRSGVHFQQKMTQELQHCVVFYRVHNSLRKLLRHGNRRFRFLRDDNFRFFARSDRLDGRFRRFSRFLRGAVGLVGVNCAEEQLQGVHGNALVRIHTRVQQERQARAVGDAILLPVAVAAVGDIAALLDQLDELNKLVVGQVQTRHSLLLRPTAQR